MIKLYNVSKYYNVNNKINLAVSSVNLEFKLNEFVLITGASGSGKSTLLNVISGIDILSDGELYFNNEETSYYENDDWDDYRKNNISFVAQDYGLIENYTVLQNVMSVLIIKGYNEETSKIKAKEIINKVGLDKHLFNKVSKLSGGEKQRLSIARAIVKDTKILVADEPTANLDKVTSKEIINLLKSISKNKLVIIVSHNFEEFKDVSTRKITMKNAKIQEDVLLRDLEEVSHINEDIPKLNNKTIFFTKLNLFSKPRINIFIFLTTLLISLSIILTFSYCSYSVNTPSDTNLTNNYFTNLDDNRVIVTKENNPLLTETDLDNLNNISNVNSVFKNDLLLDDTYKLDDFSYSNNNFHLSDLTNVDQEKIDYGRNSENINEVVIEVPYYYFNDNPLDGSNSLLSSNDISNYYLEVEVVGIILSYNENKNDTLYIHSDLLDELNLLSYFEQYSATYINNNIFKTYYFNGIVYSESNTLYLSQENYDNFITNSNELVMFELVGEDTYYINVEVSDDLYGDSFKISYSLLETIFSGYYQFSIFIDDYKNLSAVENELDNLDFLYLSVYNSSFNTNLTSKDILNNFLTTFITVIVILFVMILGYFILRLIFHNNIKEYATLKTIGLDNKTIVKVNFIELVIYFLLSTLITISVIIILKSNFIFFSYIRFSSYLMLGLINFTIIVLVIYNLWKQINKSSIIDIMKRGSVYD